MSDDWFDAFDALGFEDDNEKVRDKVLKAPVSYPGNKEYELEHILPHLPQTGMFVDVFGGTGVVLLNRKPSKVEVFNDRNSGLTALYQCIWDKKLLEQLCERLRFIAHSREAFVWSRDTWETCTDTVERAARWYYCVQCSFIKKGKYFGRSVSAKTNFAKTIQPELSLWYEIHQRISPTVQIENQDWRQILKDYDTLDTVFYLDPPYYESHGIYQVEMPDRDHVELMERIQSLRGFVAISGYPNNLYNQYGWDEHYTWSRTTKASALASTESNNNQDQSRHQVTEALWIRHPN